MARGKTCPHCGHENRFGAKYCASCGKELSTETASVTESSVKKIVAAMIVVSLASMGVLGFMGLQTTDVAERQMNTFVDENLEVIATLANATVDLQLAHESFMIYVLDFGSLAASRNYNDMESHQANFSRFLQLYHSRYSFASLPQVSVALIEEGRDDLLSEEESALTELASQWNRYEDDTVQTAMLIMEGQEQAVENSTLNATLHLENIGNCMASLIDCRDQASQLLKGLADDAINRRASTTTVATVLLGLVAVLVPLTIYWAFYRSSWSPRR
jgi:hypothetical protein